MKVFFQDNETEDVLYRIEDSHVIPNVGESVCINKAWYEVVERTFYYENLAFVDDNSCTIWIKRQE